MFDRLRRYLFPIPEDVALRRERYERAKLAAQKALDAFEDAADEVIADLEEAERERCRNGAPGERPPGGAHTHLRPA